ncbi:unnamed protein product [marine sediment metagenome]|uniref:Uncharacterized protein n=1 Tax=marine sediment metagenome TaxID=412755 RepID=X1CZ14_9ZZZZ
MLKKQSKKLILIVLGILFLTASSCSLIDRLILPVERPEFDVLEPKEGIDIVKINEDGTVVVTADFIVWVVKLKQEIERLREKLGEEW